ncbi:MAG: hypothetical protein AAGC67_11600 [Myxococcota bacterium]
MDLILNGEPQAMDTSECANLAELVTMAEGRTAEGEETVVVAVEIDGEALSADELSGLERHSLDGVGCVAIQRRPTRAVARSVLAQGADYCGQIEAAIDDCVGAFRSGRSDRGNEILADLTDSMTVLTGITVSVANILAASAQALADVQGGIFPWLEELVEAQTQEDPLRIADLLDYEIKPRIADWAVAMRALAEGDAIGVDAPLSS